MIDANLVLGLKELGLTEYESKAYLILSIYGSLSANMVSQKGKIPQSKIYEVLRSLEEKSLANIWPSTPKKYKAIDPKKALGDILKIRAMNLDQLRLKTADMLNKIKPYNQEKKDSETWIGKGEDLFIKNIIEMLDKCRNRFYLITSSFPRRFDLDEKIMDALNKKIDIKIIGLGKISEHSFVRAEWYINKGIDVKFFPFDFNINTVIIDDSEVCIKMEDNEEFMRSNQKNLIEVTKTFFQEKWSNSKPLSELFSNPLQQTL